MVSKTRVFVDTSWFKSLIDPRDDFREQAVRQSQRLASDRAELITTNFIIDESLTLIRTKAGLELALKFSKLLLDMSHYLKIVRVLVSDEKNAWEWFPNNWSKLSFTDCTSFAVMKRLGITRVATFDQHFDLAGFKLYS